MGWILGWWVARDGQIASREESRRNTKGRRESGEVRWLEHIESEIWYLFIQFNAYGVTTL